MTEYKLDWTVLKIPFVTLCSCCIVASTVVLASYDFNRRLKEEYKTSKTALQTISHHYRNVHQEAEMLRHYYPKFMVLHDKGIIGLEKRLNWIETLKRADEKIKLPSLSYAIESQKTYQPEYLPNANGYTLSASRMTVDLGLLHEGDLFQLLDYMDENATGLYTLSECQFSKKNHPVYPEKNRTNVSASCVLNWITINLAQEQEAK